ncbi:MAG: response regulator [Eubacteriales bacterium]|nr:response regulator [Eubacteriales bacterium]
MYKLIIADDERQIREGIREMLPWEEYGIYVAGMAGDGEEALRLVRELHPEILITDLRMPKMDGLALIARIREEKEACKILVLSGYNDFPLVRQAMKLGVVDYLLKPSSKEEMAKAVEEILDSLSDEILARHENRGHFELLKNHVMNRILNQTISSRELRGRLDFLGLDFDDWRFAAAVIMPFSEEKSEKQADDAFTIFEICEKILEEDGTGIVFTDSQARTVVFFRKKEISEGLAEEKAALEECMREIRGERQMPLAAGLGNPCSSHRQLARSYQEAVKALEYRGVFGEGEVLLYEETERYRGADAGGRNGSDRVLYAETERYRGADAGSRNGSDRLLYAETEHYRGPGADASGLHECLREGNAQESLSAEKKYSFLVRNTLDFVEQHYADCNLSLAYLAEQFQVNAAYLGRLFKKEVQCSFNDYLNLYRVEKAKELLRTTVYKGMEICEMVGFVNYNYFYIIFKKVTGKTPTDYRKEP